MYSSPPNGITPPAPGLEREEPELVVEDDIPKDEPGSGGADAAQDGDGLRNVERE